jgi:hypothetical protein
MRPLSFDRALSIWVSGFCVSGTLPAFADGSTVTLLCLAALGVLNLGVAFRP